MSVISTNSFQSRPLHTVPLDKSPKLQVMPRSKSIMDIIETLHEVVQTTLLFSSWYMCQCYLLQVRVYTHVVLAEIIKSQAIFRTTFAGILIVRTWMAYCSYQSQKVVKFKGNTSPSIGYTHVKGHVTAKGSHILIEEKLRVKQEVINSVGKKSTYLFEKNIKKRLNFPLKLGKYFENSDRKIKKLKEKLELKKQEIVNLNQELKGSKQKIDSIGKLNNTLIHKLENIKEKTSKELINKKRDEFRKIKNSLTKKINRYKRKILAAKNLVDKKSTEIQHLKEKSEWESSSYKQELKNIKILLSKKAKKIDKLNKKLIKDSSYLRNSIDNYKHEINQLKIINTSLSGSVNDYKYENQQLKNEIEKLRSKLKIRDEQIEKLKNRGVFSLSLNV